MVKSYIENKNNQNSLNRYFSETLYVLGTCSGHGTTAEVKAQNPCPPRVYTLVVREGQIDK